MEYNSYDVDVKGAHTDWMKMFQTVNYLNFLNQKGDLTGYQQIQCMLYFH